MEKLITMETSVGDGGNIGDYGSIDDSENPGCSGNLGGIHVNINTYEKFHLPFFDTKNIPYLSRLTNDQPISHHNLNRPSIPTKLPLDIPN